MNRIVETVLPSKPDGVIRNFAIEHTNHGDIRLEFWDGVAKPSIIESLEKGIYTPYPRYAFPHTFHGLLVAALMGYLTRIKTPETEIKELLHDARLCIEAKKPHDNSDSRWGLRSLSQGVPVSRYNIAENNWQALTSPVPPEPGSRLLGGTELFTTDKAELVIATITEEMDDRSIVVSLEHATILTKRDIPPIATAIAKISLGESIDTIGTLFRERFDI